MGKNGDRRSSRRPCHRLRRDSNQRARRNRSRHVRGRSRTRGRAAANVNAMRGVLPIVVAAGYTATPPPATPTPLAEAAPAAETVWDRGTYVTIDNGVVFADSEENFEIFRTPAGYRMTVQW